VSETDAVLARLEAMDRRASEDATRVLTKIDDLRDDVGHLRSEVVRLSVTVQHQDVRIRQNRDAVADHEDRLSRLERGFAWILGAAGVGTAAAVTAGKQVAEFFGFGSPQ